MCNCYKYVRGLCRICTRTFWYCTHPTLSLAVDGFTAGPHHTTVSVSFYSLVASHRLHTFLSYSISAMHINTSTPSFHPCFLAFSVRTTLAHLSLFFPLLAVILSPFTHHSFISISPKVIWVEHISYLPLLPQSLLKPLRRHSYLKIHPFFPSGFIHHSNY